MTIGSFQTEKFEPILTVVVVALAFLVPIYFSILDPDWHHDGIMFKPAADVAAGLSLYKDSFYQYGFLTAHLQAFFINVFGKYLIVLRLQSAVLLGMSGLLMFALARRVSSTSVAAIVVIVWLGLAPYIGETFLPWSSIYALFFVLLAAYLLVNAFDEDTSTRYCYWLCFLAGFSLTAAFWTRQPFGLMLPLMFMLFPLLALDRGIDNRRIGIAALGYCLGFLPLSLIILYVLNSETALQDWWIQSFAFAQKFTSVSTDSQQTFVTNLVRHLLPQPHQIGGIGGGPIWRTLPILMLLAFLGVIFCLVFFRKQSTELRNLLIISLLSIGMWHQYFPVSGAWQIYWGATPMIVVVVTALYRLCMNYTITSRFHFMLVLIPTGLLFGPEVQTRVSPLLETIPAYRISIPTLEGMWASPKLSSRNRFDGTVAEYKKELDELGQVLSKIRSLDSERALITLTEDLYLAATLAADNPSPVTAGWLPLHRLYPRHRKQLKDFIAAKQPVIETSLKPRVPNQEFNWFSQDAAHISIRQKYGLDDYGVILQTEFSDSGTRLLLAPKDFITLYKARFKDSQ